MTGVKQGQILSARIGALACLGLLLLLAVSCSQAPADSLASPPAQSHSQLRAEYESEARQALGDGGRVLLSGDLAHNRHIQLLVVNSLSQMPASRTGVSVSRAAILEKDGGDWREVFLADDHLKNDKGFLQGAPQGSVSAWRLRYEQGKDGLTMFFTPLEQPAGSDKATVEVRWNPAKLRYQSFESRSRTFLSEAPYLGPTPSYFIKR
jgi:hypothetical protein